MVFGDIMGFSESDYVYNQSRAHSADMFFVKARFWFWGITLTVASFLTGNMLGVFDINVMGWLVNGVMSWFH